MTGWWIPFQIRNYSRVFDMINLKCNIKKWWLNHHLTFGHLNLDKRIVSFEWWWYYYYELNLDMCYLAQWEISRENCASKIKTFWDKVIMRLCLSWHLYWFCYGIFAGIYWLIWMYYLIFSSIFGKVVHTEYCCKLWQPNCLTV